MESFKELWTSQIAEQMREFREQIEAIVATPECRALTFNDQALAAFRKLVLQGWTIQMQLSHHVFHAVLSGPQSTNSS
jgi:hypothetical protein